MEGIEGYPTGDDPCGGPPCICLTASSDALEAIRLARELNAAEAEVALLRQFEAKVRTAMSGADTLGKFMDAVDLALADLHRARSSNRSDAE